MWMWIQNEKIIKTVGIAQHGLSSTWFSLVASTTGTLGRLGSQDAFSPISALALHLWVTMPKGRPVLW